MKSLQQIADQVAAVGLNPTQKFTGYVYISPGSAGTLTCTPIPIPAGTLIRLESIAGATYSDPAAIAFIRYFVKESAGSSRILIKRLASDVAISDPVANTRSFYGDFVLWVRGGPFADVPIGDTHAVIACIQPASGQTAPGAFVLTGTYVTPPTAGAAPDPIAEATATDEATARKDPTLHIASPAPPPEE
jgi:hypothetical protein